LTSKGKELLDPALAQVAYNYQSPVLPGPLRKLPG
jgi:hypothetical protein